MDITSYGTDRDGRPTLGALVRDLLAALPDLPRLRLSSLDCIEVDPVLLGVIADEARLMPHWHLSLQSGSDMILKRMKRRHARADAVRFCSELRALRPGVVFGADVIVGFPTETDAMFADSLRLIEDCGLTHLHVFPYSPRPGTPAARMPPVSAGLVRERAARLRDAGARALQRHLARQRGRMLRVLMERGGRGRAEDFTPVRPLASIAPNTFADVLIADDDGRELIGTPVWPGSASPSGTAKDARAP